MISWRSLLKASVAIIASPVIAYTLLGQEAKADWFGPLHGGEFGWIALDLRPGDYTITARTLGDVDIELYNESRTRRFNIIAQEDEGYDTMKFTVNNSGRFFLKYSMRTCFNPSGPCRVEVKLY